MGEIDPYKSLGSNKLHLRVLRKLGVSLKSHSLSSLEIHGDQERYPTTGESVFKKSQKVDVGNYRPDNLSKSLRKSWSESSLNTFLGT